jgi:hypothetical protein
MTDNAEAHRRADLGTSKWSAWLALSQIIIWEAEETKHKALWALDQVEDRMVLDYRKVQGASQSGRSHASPAPLCHEEHTTAWAGETG